MSERRIEQDWPQIWSHLARGTGAVGGFIFYRYAALDGTARTIVPDDENDVARGLWIMWAGYTSSGVFFGGCNQCANGGALKLYDDGGTNTLQLAVAAAGAATVSRTAGTKTYDLVAWVVWL